MAVANTVASKGGTVVSADPNFTVTKEIRNRKDGVYLFLKYTIGTSGGLTISFKTYNKGGILTATDGYSVIQLTAAAIAACSYTIAAAGKYKIPIPLTQYDDTLEVTIVFGGATADGVVQADILEA